MAIYENAKPLSYIFNKGLTPNPYKSAYKMGGIIFVAIIAIISILIKCVRKKVKC